MPHDRQSAGHSDADVVLHAIIDALLGATAQGDIGEWFPDTDPVNRGRDSGEMLAQVLAQVNQSGFRLINIDCTIFAQRPKLSPYKDAIRRRIAELLGVRIDQVGLKAKTGEEVGPVGREEAVMAQTIVSLESR